VSICEILENDHQERLQQLIHENGALRMQLNQKVEKLINILEQRLKHENVFIMRDVKDADTDTMKRYNYLSQLLDLNKRFMTTRIK
jgi:uncharacterized protein YgfB (UPF0149 family)